MTPYEQYLMPDPNLREPKPESDSLADTLPSLTSRELTLHSAYSVHGWDFFDRTKVWYESELELTFARLAKMRRDVAGIAEQPPAVRYIDDDGVEHPHTFDFLLKMKNGTRGFVAVKPFGRVEQTGVGRVVELIAEQISPSLADWTLLFTEHDLSPIDLFNAGAIHHARRDPWPEDDVVMAKVLARLKGEFTIGELAAKSRLGGYGFDAVVRALADGKIKLAQYGDLDDRRVVVVPGRKRKP